MTSPSKRLLLDHSYCCKTILGEFIFLLFKVDIQTFCQTLGFKFLHIQILMNYKPNVFSRYLVYQQFFWSKFVSWLKLSHECNQLFRTGLKISVLEEEYTISSLLNRMGIQCLRCEFSSEETRNPWQHGVQLLKIPLLPFTEFCKWAETNSKINDKKSSNWQFTI